MLVRGRAEQRKRKRKSRAEEEKWQREEKCLASDWPPRDRDAARDQTAIVYSSCEKQSLSRRPPKRYMSSYSRHCHQSRCRCCCCATQVRKMLLCHGRPLCRPLCIPLCTPLCILSCIPSCILSCIPYASPSASSHASPLCTPPVHPPLCTLPLVQVRKMLCYDPAARVSAREVVAHPWIRSQVPDPLSTRLCTSQHPHASPHAPLCTPVDTLPGRPLSNLAALHGLSQRINGRNHLGLLRVPPHRSTCPRSRRPPRPAAAAAAAAASPARR